MLLALLFSAPVRAEVPPEVRDAAGIETHPLEDGLLVWQRVEIVLGDDGRVTRSEDSALKMLSAKSTRADFFDPHIDWNDARAELSVDDARSWMVDGTEVVAKANSRVPNTASELQWAVPYAHMRRMTVAHVGVEHGATSRLAYSLTDREPMGLPLWGALDLNGPFPVLQQRVRVAGRLDLAWAVLGGEGVIEVGEVTDEGNSVVLERANVPAHDPAEGWPAPRLVWSTASSWDAVREVLRGRIDPALEPDDRVRAKVEDLVEPGMLAAERTAVLHRFVVEGVRTVEWPVASFDHAARPAGEVLDSSVGHSLDKAVLLVAMLRAAGLDGHIALVSSGWAIAEAVPAPAQLDEVWVQTDGVWFDPTALRDNHNLWHLAGHPVLLLDGSGAPKALEVPAGEDVASLRLVVDLEDGGHEVQVSGSAEVDLAREYNPVVGWDRSSDRLLPLAEGVAGGFGGAAVDATAPGRLDDELCSLHAEFSKGVLSFDAAGLVRLEVPRVPGTVGGLQVWRQERDHPVRVPTGRERVALELTLPEDLEPAWLPEPVELKNRAGSLVRTIERDGQNVEITEELVLSTAVVAPNAWPELRALLSAMERGRTVLLQRVE
jgi:hypothetical protein